MRSRRTTAAFVARGLGTLGTVASQAIAARVLSLDDYGLLAVVLTVAAGIAIGGTLGLSRSTARVMAEVERDLRPPGTEAGLLLGSGLALLAFVTVVGLVAAGLGGVPFGIAVALLILGRSFEMAVGDYKFGRGRLLAGTIAGSGISTVLAAALLALAALVWGHQTPLPVVISCFGAASLFAGAMASRGILRTIRHERAAEGQALITRSLTREALPLWLAGMAGFSIGHVDTIILAVVVGATQTAIYTPASRLAALLVLPLTAAAATAQASLAKSIAAGRLGDAQNIARARAREATMLAAPPALLFIVFGGPILGFAFGPEFRAGAGVLAVLSIGRLIGVALGPSAVVLTSGGSYNVVMRWQLIAAVATIAITFVGAFLWQGMGVAVATSIGIVGLNVSLYISAKTHLSIGTAIV